MKENGRTVLLVDDDRSILRTFARILQRAGFQTETAEWGRSTEKDSNEQLRYRINRHSSWRQQWVRSASKN